MQFRDAARWIIFFFLPAYWSYHFPYQWSYFPSRCMKRTSAWLQATRENQLETTIVLDENDPNEDKLHLFQGPIANYEDIEIGFDLQELGISLMVGKSQVSEGRGLFLSVANETINEIIIPKGTILCGYSKGEFKRVVEGDKTVSCFLSDLHAAVIYQKKLQSLIDVIENVTNLNLSSIDTSQNCEQFAKVVVGHKLHFNESQVMIFPDLPDYQNYFFVPFPIKRKDDLSILNVGVYANDLAFDSKNIELNEEVYRNASKERNFVQLIWRLEYQNNQLVPTWPVVIFIKDVIIKNLDPMEIGLEYGWNYWEAKKRKEQHQESSARTRIFRKRKLVNS